MKEMLDFLVGQLSRIPVVGRPLSAALSSYVWVGLLLCIAEIALNGLIVWKVPYTEIDWKAYMEEVKGPILRNDYNYSNLRGETGPLVYPAGFVGVFSLLFFLTDRGTDIVAAQAIFVALYLCTFAAVAAIYRAAAPRGFHPLLLAALCLSKRVHSIFVLRLFNDGPTMLLLYAAVLLLIHRRWTAGCACYSLAFSLKMNIILFAPALGVLLLAELGAAGLLQQVAMCAGMQLLLAAPFLAADPAAYVRGAFDVTRVFKRYWSVNFKWVPCTPLPPAEETLLRDCGEGPFASRWFGQLLAVLLVASWLLFAHYQWCAWGRERRTGGGGGGTKGGSSSSSSSRSRVGRGLGALFVSASQDALAPSPGRQQSDGQAGAGEDAGGGASFSPRQIALMFFSSNFLGMVFARSLHFQAYVWYFHSLPLLLWSTPLPAAVNVLLLVAIEAAWNPWEGETSSVASSILLTVCHAIIVIALWVSAPPGPDATEDGDKLRKSE